MTTTMDRYPLTEDQLQALRLAAQGFTGEQAAQQLTPPVDAYVMRARLRGARMKLGAYTLPQAVYEAHRRGLLAGPVLNDRGPTLTEKQRRILHLLGPDGLTVLQIVRKVGMGSSTIYNHLTEAKAALGARNTAHCVYLACLSGDVHVQAVPSAA